MARLETTRCQACDLSADHMHDMQQLYRDPRVAALLFGDAVEPPGDAAGIIIGRFAAHWTAHGFGPYAFFERTRNGFVGYAGLRHTIADGVAGVELLYAVRPEFWGRGICTEIAQCTVESGARQLGLREVVSFTLPENTASQRVLEKLGFQETGPCVYGGVPHTSFRRAILQPAVGGAL